jgi:molybdenum cofactor cytidylyltransferase
MTVGVLVLAAGQARRFGADKRMATLRDGSRSIEALLEQLNASGLPAVVCIGPEDKEIAALLDRHGVHWQVCKRSGEGMGGTLAEGIACANSWEGVLVVLADMPWTWGSTYQTVANRVEEKSICVPTYAGRRGHPVGFGKKYYQEIAALGGDIGARGLLEKYPDNVLEVTVDDPGILRDIDKPEDIASTGNQVEQIR